MEAWLVAMLKSYKQTALLRRVRERTLTRAVLRHWFARAVTRLDVVAGNVTKASNQWYRSHTLRHWRTIYAQRINDHRLAAEVKVVVRKYHRRVCFRRWRDLLAFRALEARVASRMRVYFLREALAQWQGARRHYRAVNNLTARTHRSLLMPIFKNWRTKFGNKCLLRRVFTLREVAWAHRQYDPGSNPSPFYLLLRVLTAWAMHARESTEIKRKMERHTTALVFRGVTLLAR